MFSRFRLPRLHPASSLIRGLSALVLGCGMGLVAHAEGQLNM